MRASVEGKVIKPHIEQKFYPLPDFLNDFRAYLFLPFAQPAFKIIKPFMQLLNIHPRKLGNIFFIYSEIKRFFLQPSAFTFRANDGLHKALYPSAHRGGSIFPVLVDDEVGNAFERYRLMMPVT